MNVVGLLKRPKSRLESEWHPQVPRPRYTLESWPFSILGPRPFSCYLEFWTGLNPRLGVDLCPKLSNPEMSRESICSFAGGRLTFLKLGSTSVGFFSGCVLNFFEIQESQILAFKYVREH